MDVTLTRYNSETDNVPKTIVLPLDGVVKFLTRPHVRQTKLGTPCFSPVVYGTKRRAKTNVTFVTMVVADFDGTLTLEELTDILTRRGLASVVHTSWSNFLEEGVWKIRAAIFLKNPIPADEWHEGAAARILVGLFDLAADASCLDASHVYYLHSYPPERAEHAVAFSLDGEPLDPATIEDPPPEQIAEWYAIYRRKRPQHVDHKGAAGTLDQDRSFWQNMVGSVGTRPGDEYNRHHWQESLDLLIAGGARIEKQVGDKYYLTRPGKSGGVSASFGHCRNPDGVPLLYIWSNQWPPFEIHRTIDPFGILTALRHGGIHKDAAKALAERGIGVQTKPVSTSGKKPRTLPASETVVPPEAPQNPEMGETATDDSAGPYRVVDGQLYRCVFSENGFKDVLLANFASQITHDVTHDDGLNQTRFFRIQASLPGGPIVHSDLTPTEYERSPWHRIMLGPKAYISIGRNNREHLLLATQTLSDPQPRTVFTATGPVKIDGVWRFVHADLPDTGSVGASLPASLSRFKLPPPLVGEALRDGIQAVLRLMKAGRAEITLPGLSAVFRAVFGNNTFGLFYYGRTGGHKSTWAALLQQFYGAEMTGFPTPRPPASWSASTANSLESLTFSARDCLLWMDEGKPSSPDPRARADLQMKYERVFRGLANGSGRGRLDASANERATKYPRCLVLATGEEPPLDPSLVARILILTLKPGDLPLDQLRPCQADAANGVYAGVLSAFWEWIAPDYPDRQERFQQDVLRCIDFISQSIPVTHDRTPVIVANLLTGFRMFLRFAVDRECLPSEEAEKHYVWAKTVFLRLCRGQAARLAEADPCHRYFELLANALASGACHVASRECGLHPQINDGSPVMWGWRQRFLGGESDNFEWIPQGPRIGFVEKSDLYLLPDASFSVAEQMARNGGDGMGCSAKVLGKLLADGGHLVARDGDRNTHSFLVGSSGKSRGYHVKADSVCEFTSGSEEIK